MRRILIAGLLLACGLAGISRADNGPAPVVRLATDQGEISLDDLRGQVVYVDFWASWCAPCRKSFPWMQTMQKRYADRGLTVLAVNLDSDRASAERFLRGQHVDFRIAYDPAGHSAEQFKVPGMPSSYLIDRNGRIRQRHVGFLDKDTDSMEMALRTLLQE